VSVRDGFPVQHAQRAPCTPFIFKSLPLRPTSGVPCQACSPSLGHPALNSEAYRHPGGIGTGVALRWMRQRVSNDSHVTARERNARKRRVVGSPRRCWRPHYLLPDAETHQCPSYTRCRQSGCSSRGFVDERREHGSVSGVHQPSVTVARPPRRRPNNRNCVRGGERLLQSFLECPIKTRGVFLRFAGPKTNPGPRRLRRPHRFCRQRPQAAAHRRGRAAPCIVRGF
jgi:hypothetical protein